MAGQFSRFNAIDQLLDVAGSERQANDRLLTDETGGLGSPVILNSGAAATITAFTTPNLSIGGLTGMAAGSVGSLLSIRGAAEAGNNGVFLINTYTDANDVIVTDSNGYFPDANSGSLEWENYNAGNTATISAFGSGLVTFTGLANMSQNSVGHFMSVSGAGTAGNNGTFLIVAYISATSVQVANVSGAFPDANSGAISWLERLPYSLNDDLDFERSDRTYIKGVNYDQPMPTYTRPTLSGVAVPASIANLAGKTLDAFARNINRGLFSWPVEATLTDIYGSVKHSDPVDQTGVPVFDTGPFTSDWESCYVEVTNSLSGVEMYVLAGPQIGNKIYGVTYNGTSTSPTSVEVRWYSAPPGANIATAGVAYTWEIGTATGTNTGTTAVTVTPGSTGLAAITGLTAGTFTSADVGNWVNFSGFAASAGVNNGNFVIVSVQSTSAITIQHAYAVSETHSASWAEYNKSQETFVNLTYGYNERLDQLDQNAFRFPFVSGLVADSSLQAEIDDILSTAGWSSGTTNLASSLTNTSNYYVFSTLPGGAGDTVVSALNALNQQIGNRTYTGAYLTNGQSITASLQALSNAISGSTITRYITRLSSASPANTPITLPGGATYVVDGTNNGRGLFVFWRGVLRDPGTVANGDDYQETSTTSITPYAKLNKNDHISFFVA